jgi:hypothetical protein
MLDSRLPLTVRPAPGGFAVVFADGGQHIFVSGGGSGRGDLTGEQAWELAVAVAKALSAVWLEEMRPMLPLMQT